MAICATSRMHKVVLAAVTAALIAVTATGCASGATAGETSDGAPIKVRIAYNPNTTYLSIAVAEEQGYFADHGLDAQLTPSSNTSTLIPSIGQQFEFIPGGPGAILSFNAQASTPKAILVSAQTIENPTDRRNTYLVGKDISSVDELKGKTIGLNVLSGTQYTGLLKMLADAGIKEADVKLVQVPFADMANTLASGSIDAALAISPFGQSLLSEGYNDLGNTIEYLLGDHVAMSTGWIVSPDFLENNKVAVDAFLAAQKDAYEWIKSNPDGAKEIMINDFQMKEKAVAAIDPAQFLSFTVEASYLGDWIEPLTDAGQLPENFAHDPATLVYLP